MTHSGALRSRRHGETIGAIAVTYGSGCLQMERVDNFEEGEAVEVCVTCADPANSVFAHKYSRVGIVHEIAGKVREFCNDLARDLGMSLRGDEDVKPRRRNER